METTYPFWNGLIKGMHRHCRRLRKQEEIDKVSFADFEKKIVYVWRVILRIFDVLFYCFHCLQKLGLSGVLAEAKNINKFVKKTQLQYLPSFPVAVGILSRRNYLYYQCRATTWCNFNFCVKFIAGQQPQILVNPDPNFCHSCRMPMVT